jgi:hypothetical protein
MTDLRTAAQQALEALKSVQDHRPNDETNAAVTALRAALAQQDEPKGGGNLPPPLQAEPVQDQDDILRMAQEAGIIWWSSDQTFLLTRFASLVAAAEREKVAHWMRSMGYATGHGDTIEDLLDHLGTQIAEGREVEACADICDQHASVEGIAQRCAEQIRARGKT